MNKGILNADYRDMIECLQHERAVQVAVDGLSLKMISLDDLIVNKRASGRPKDISDTITLEKLKAKLNG